MVRVCAYLLWSIRTDLDVRLDLRKLESGRHNGALDILIQLQAHFNIEIIHYHLMIMFIYSIVEFLLQNLFEVVILDLAVFPIVLLLEQSNIDVFAINVVVWLVLPDLVVIRGRSRELPVAKERETVDLDHFVGQMLAVS